MYVDAFLLSVHEHISCIVLHIFSVKTVIILHIHAGCVKLDVAGNSLYRDSQGSHQTGEQMDLTLTRNTLSFSYGQAHFHRRVGYNYHMSELFS